MTRFSCIRHPARNRYIQLFEWQGDFCRGNPCAAMLLSHFSSWHDWKIRHDQYYRRCNDIAEKHGDDRLHTENAFLFFTMDDFLKACMGLSGKDAIRKGLALLVELGVISVHANPNPRYRFDKTKYFLFYPEVCSQWIDEHCSLDGAIDEGDAQADDNYDSSFLDDRQSESRQPSQETRRPSQEFRQAITDTTNNTTNNNKSINTTGDFHDHEKILAGILLELKRKGMPGKRLSDRSELMRLAGLVGEGATLAMISSAYDLAEKATAASGRNFGIRYLEKVIRNLLEKEKYRKFQDAKQKKSGETIYENDFSGGLGWMGDLIEKK